MLGSHLLTEEIVQSDVRMEARKARFAPNLEGSEYLGAEVWGGTIRVEQQALEKPEPGFSNR